MRTVDNINFSGKKALIRVDFNVPLNKQTFEITDDTRIRAAIPTVKKVLQDGGAVVLMSHLGRPKSGPEAEKSLKHLVDRISTLLDGTPVKFVNDCIGSGAEQASAELKMGEVLLLENLRFYKQETAGTVEFAEQLSKHGDVYVNDAFGTAHRAHASTAVIAQFFEENKAFGYVMANEIANVEKVLNEAEKPYTAIIGGAKVSSKITIIENLLDKIDNLIIGGGMAYTFAKAQGGQVGSSLVEDDFLDTAKQVLELADSKGVKVLIPKDTVAADKFDNEATQKECLTGSIESGWMGLDIGTEAIKENAACIEASKTILWNGPMGVFEMSNFENGTKQAALAVAEATKKGAYSLVGGGDSVAAVNKFDLAEQVSYVSTGGGALLEYMEGKELPGVKAIMG